MNDFDDSIDLAPPVQRTVPAAGAPLPDAVRVNGRGVWAGLMRSGTLPRSDTAWRRVPLGERVLQCIEEHGPLTNAEIAAALDCPRNSVTWAIGNLMRAGLLRRISNECTGRYPRPPLELASRMNGRRET